MRTENECRRSTDLGRSNTKRRVDEAVSGTKLAIGRDPQAEVQFADNQW